MSDTALILIDLINEIIHPQGKIASCAAMITEYNVLAKTNRTLAAARGHNALVAFVNVGFSKDYRELLPSSPIFGKTAASEALQLGSWGCALHGEVAYQPQDILIVKHSISPFYGTILDLILRRRGIKKLIVGGVATDMAIQSAVREGHDLGYKIFLCDDLCAARTKEDHDLSIEQLKRLATVCHADEVFEK